METWRADLQKLGTTWTFTELTAHASHLQLTAEEQSQI